MHREEVTLADGSVKVVVANSVEGLAEGVAAVKSDRYPESPDLHGQKDANKIVSPENLHTEPAFVQATADPLMAEMPAEESDVEEEPVVKKEAPKKSRNPFKKK